MPETQDSTKEFGAHELATSSSRRQVPGLHIHQFYPGSAPAKVPGPPPGSFLHDLGSGVEPGVTGHNMDGSTTRRWVWVILQSSPAVSFTVTLPSFPLKNTGKYEV